MNARESLVHAVYPEAEGPGTNELLDAYRAEVLAEAKFETVAWLVKKAAEQQTWDAAVLASKIDRGAVRAFIGTAHYRDAMDAHRAQVLRELRRSVIAASLAGPTDQNASDTWTRGYRAGLSVAADLATPTVDEPAPDFFQPGHSYTHRNGTDFQCIAVTASANTGEPRALGWTVRNGWHQPAALDPDDWTHSYDGCQPPTAPDTAYAATRGEPGEGQ